MTMADVPFTQYVPPNGRREPVVFETDDAHAEKAQAIRDRGFDFEIEVLRTGDVSATIADPILEEDVEIVVAKNGPPIASGIEAMIDRFHSTMGDRRAGDEGAEAA
jgi:hypothetical protein